MAQLHNVQTNFSSGEIEPLMAFRSDTGAFQNGAASLRNCLLLSTGGAARRPGTNHLNNLTADCRLLPFEFSASQRYILGFSNGRLDVFDAAGALVTSISSGCNWTTATLFEMTYAQVADVMIVCHQNWRTQVIRRTGASSFTVSNFAFDQSIDGNKVYQPYYKFADDTVTLSCSGTTGSVTLTASSGVFTSALVGERLRWHDVEIEVTAYTNATTMTGTIKGTLRGDYDLNPFRSANGSGTVEVTHVDHGFATGQSVTLSGANGTGGITAAQLTGTFTITVIDDHHYSVTTGGTATESIDGGGPNVKFTSSTTATRNWAEPAICTKNGWPGAVCFHEGRLWFGGTSGIPDGIWSSQIYRYFSFDVGEGLDNESIQVTVGANDISNVRHLVSHRDLLIFTALGEFYAPPPNSGALTPASMTIKRQTPYGCSTVTPLPFDGATLYVQGSGTAVREFLYSDGQAGYASTNLNVLSGHLISTPRDMAVLFGSTNRSEQYALVVNSDGTMAVFHSARAENLAGWTPWQMGGDGTVRSVCVLGEGIYLAVLRNSTYRLEKVASTHLSQPLDGAISYTSATPKTAWTVNAIYYNRTVHVVSGNYYLGEYPVSGAGAITLNAAVDAITVGYDFDFRIVTLPANIQLPNGPMTGLPKRINRVVVGLNSALALSISGNRLLLRQVGDDFSTVPEAVTGTREFYLLGYQRDAVVALEQQEPLPCVVLGLLMEVTF